MLTFTSCQALVAEFTMRDIAQYLAHTLHLETRYVDDLDWQERYAKLDSNEIDVGWICGAPYVQRLDEQKLNLELLAAPVMAAPRYNNQPTYFSDVVVRADSRFQTFADLRGARWAYNEPHSHSGYQVVRWFLAQRGLDGSYFGSVVQSGAHINSLNLVLQGEVDASAIDCTVLDLLCAQDRTLQDQFRVIETMGPSPIPPYIIGRHVSVAVRERLKHALTHMHESTQGATILQRGQVSHFAAVADADYDRTRQMLRLAQKTRL